MSKSKLALVVASCLAIAAPVALAGGNDPEAEQARDHAKEVQQLRQRDQEFARERREQAEKDRRKLKEIKEDAQEQAETEEGFGNDLDEDGVDGSE